MKKVALSLILFALCTVSLFGQQYFEGKIRFGISMEGEGADQMAAFMPTSYDYHIKGLNMRFKINGGMMAALMGEFYLLGESQETYMVKHDIQTAYKIAKEDDETPTTKPAFKKLAETQEIAGYKCQKYEVSLIDAETGEQVTQYMWVTNEIKMKAMNTANLKMGGNVFLDGMEGFPLKIATNVQGMSMILTATSVEKKELPASEFKIPAGYSVEEFDPAMFGN